MTEKEMSKKMIDELLNYYYLNGIFTLQVNVTFVDEGFCVMIQGNTETLPASMEEFEEAMRVPRDLSFEEYSHEILGSPHYDREDYHTLGALIDEAEIDFQESVLTIKLFRKKI